MDMLNILKNFDSAEKGEKTSAGTTSTNEMKMILESFNSVEECGMDMPAAPMKAPEPDPVTMNVSLNARGKDAIQDLIDIMKGQEASLDTHRSHDGHDDMKRLMALSTDEPMDGPVDMPIAIKGPTEDEEVDEWDNEPDEEYRDTEYMTKDIAGGLNREKKSYKPTAGGDNPMALETRIKQELAQALAEKFSKS
jgi:hypothetical protein